jgi:hypothetical protein
VSTFIRWLKFNLVGAMGMIVQLGRVPHPSAVLSRRGGIAQTSTVHSPIQPLHHRVFHYWNLGIYNPSPDPCIRLPSGGAQ